MKLSITETTEKSKSIEKTAMGTVSIPLQSSTHRTQKPVPGKVAVVSLIAHP
jgi:hypothetical protein